MDLLLAVAFVALIIFGWALAMRRFQMRWWTVVAAIVLLIVLFLVFFRAEDEDAPESSRGGRVPATRSIVQT